MAKDDLLNKYGINVYEAEETELTEEFASTSDYEEGHKQIRLIDFILHAFLLQNKKTA